MKKYYILLMVSLVNAFDQLDASYFKGLKKPVAASLAVMSRKALTSCADDKNKGDTHNTVVVSEKITPKLGYSKIINSDVHNQVINELKKQAVNFPDDFIQEKLADDFDSIEGLEYEQLTSHAQRVAYLKYEFKGHKLTDDFNFNLIAWMINAIDYTDFISKIYELARQDKSDVITMHYVHKSLALIRLRRKNRIKAQSLYPDYDIKILDKIISAYELEKNKFYLLNENMKISIAYHEAGHALMSVLRPFGSIVGHLLIDQHGFFDGVNFLVPLYRSYSSLSAYSVEHDDTLAQFENSIMGYLAGGIGMQLLQGRKLSYKEFLTSAQEFGMGDQQSFGSDWWNIYKAATSYCKYKNLVIASIYQEDLESRAEPSDEQILVDINVLIEEFYEEAYAILQANKDKLDAIVMEALNKGVISGDEIYKLVGIQRPKFYFELTPVQIMQRDFIRWLSWTYKRMNFYERNYPQV